MQVGIDLPSQNTMCTLMFGVIQIAVIYYRGSNFIERRMPDPKFLFGVSKYNSEQCAF